MDYLPTSEADCIRLTSSFLHNHYDCIEKQCDLDHGKRRHGYRTGSQLPVCCYLAALGGWRGSWVTPTRHLLPFGYVSEGGAQGKGRVMDFWAGSNNEPVWQGECRRRRAVRGSYAPSWGRFCRPPLGQHQGLAAAIAAL